MAKTGILFHRGTGLRRGGGFGCQANKTRPKHLPQLAGAMHKADAARPGVFCPWRAS